MTHFIWLLFERKRPQPIICRTFPITDADEAHTLVASNTTTGKVVLTIPTRPKWTSYKRHNAAAPSPSFPSRCWENNHDGKTFWYSGAVHMAGAVKSANRHAVSDWMEMEKAWISITSSVLQFEYSGKRVNLLDTPGHADFSEDTYRTLAAVDSAVMLIDVAKGVESRTLKLFEVCRMRKLPIITFVNKMDRPGLEPIDLLDSVSSTLNIRTVPLNWPIGSGQEFQGIYNMLDQTVTVYERGAPGGTEIAEEKSYTSTTLPSSNILGKRVYDTLVEEIELLAEAGDPWSLEEFLAGEVTLFFFGICNDQLRRSTLTRCLNGPRARPITKKDRTGEIDPLTDAFTGFVFKIQANMNPRHRDRIAFMRVASGRFERGMSVKLARTNKPIKLAKPHSFLASERSIVDDAHPAILWAFMTLETFGIGDTLAVGKPNPFLGIPRFAPEHFARIRLKDPTRRKHLQNGLLQCPKRERFKCLSERFRLSRPLSRCGRDASV